MTTTQHARKGTGDSELAEIIFDIRGATEKLVLPPSDRKVSRRRYQEAEELLNITPAVHKNGRRDGGKQIGRCRKIMFDADFLESDLGNHGFHFSYATSTTNRRDKQKWNYKVFFSKNATGEIPDDLWNYLTSTVFSLYIWENPNIACDANGEFITTDDGYKIVRNNVFTLTQEVPLVRSISSHVVGQYTFE